jgi:Flp pilus assembly protein CpaB
VAAPSVSNVAPILARDKAQAPAKALQQKRNPLVPVAIVAIVVLAASGLWRTFHQTDAPQTVKVLVAGKDIPPGVKLGFTTLRFLDVPKQFATEGMQTSLRDLNGRVTRSFIPAGEPVKGEMLLPQQQGLSYNLENHERAITLQLDDGALVGHSILPDDLVDVLAVTTKDGKKFTKTICQRVRVLMSTSREQTLARHNNASSSNEITLAVTPDSAEAITEGTEVGKIRLLLRNRLSRVDSHLPGAAIADLLPECATPPSAALNTIPLEIVTAPPKPVAQMPHEDLQPPGPLQWMVEVFTGNHKESYGVPEK